MEWWSIGVMLVGRGSQASKNLGHMSRSPFAQRGALQYGRAAGMLQAWSAPSGNPNPADAGCNSDLAQYSHTPILHHSAWPDSRTRTKRLVRQPADLPRSGYRS
jgi:hypothetical protein